MFCSGPFCLLLQRVQAYRISEDLSSYIQCHFRSCIDRPFHQCQMAVADLDAGYAPGMDAASGIEVGRVGGTDHWAMGMSCNQDMPVLFGPSRQFFSCGMFACIVLCGAGRIQKSHVLCPGPDMADQKAG